MNTDWGRGMFGGGLGWEDTLVQEKVRKNECERRNGAREVNEAGGGRRGR